MTAQTSLAWKTAAVKLLTAAPALTSSSGNHAVGGHPTLFLSVTALAVVSQAVPAAVLLGGLHRRRVAPGRRERPADESA